MTLYSLNALCMPIKGYNRSIIYDLNRNDYYFISNEICTLLSKFTFSLSNIDKSFKELLLKNELIFRWRNLNINSFPKLKLEYLSPYSIEVLLIDIEINETFIKKLSIKYVNNLTVIIDSSYEMDSLINKILIFSSLIHYESLSLVFKKESYVQGVEFSVFETIPELFEVIVFNSETNNNKTRTNFNLIIKRYSFDIDYFNSNVFHDRFSVNANTFLISKNFNLFFFKKLYINKDNKIYHDYTQKKYFEEDTINQIEKTEINKLTKEKILVCKDCEFRNMCLDPRIPIKIGESYYFENECNYNPYISKWSDEEGYKNLIESGVEITDDGKVKINRKKLKKVFEEAWAE